jgi:hypothetical protein
VLRSNGRSRLDLWSGSLAQGQTQTLDWNATDDSGSVLPSGLYYLVFIDGDGTHEEQKILILR